jgi:hypothetical protein
MNLCVAPRETSLCRCEIMEGMSSPYREILGDDFDQLHPHVQRAHLAPLIATGSLDVTHGSGVVAGAMRKAMHLPSAGLGQPVSLSVTAVPGGIEWSRRIGSTPLKTLQTNSRGKLVERGGPGKVLFTLEVADGSLRYLQHSASFLGVPVPRLLSPSVAGLVSPTDDGWRVEVIVTWRGRLICQYQGEMRAQ